MTPEEKINTVVISFKLPKEWLKIMDDMCKLGYFLSRSDLIRKALRDLLFNSKWAEIYREEQKHLQTLDREAETR